ncbi:phosphoenolpyruvate carboxykinase (ATP) [Ferroacidibacillus organovorans]|uniref:Phosphoenolpyruvate carboxykinase (ATP) n=1 Tax=Ferroacidibacillus organovorans TaxID=1765683 RepID=A0A101XTU8_9BACL|nr:phosphoenolpyruvate carboxykinase (ATP) [Ferroacidibacillus organovorans]KUO97457.1 phosphoenolpyruvate carboxykinase [Ferroacidibacillus organovorans]KUO97479.1 phosphoenolpyruvate carboxykinase [Ferroacidibacillus organovorans]
MIDSLITDRLTSTLDASLSYFNLSVAELTEHAIRRNEAIVTKDGALRATTGKFTGRSPKDKYVVVDETTENTVHWGAVNQRLSESTFLRLYNQALSFLATNPSYVFDGFAGADPAVRMPIRVVTEYAWHNLFAKQLFIRPSADEVSTHTSGFTVIDIPALKADPTRDGTNSETCVAISFKHRTVLILGTEYAGEMKKSIFTALNFTLPAQDILPMHCSANTTEDGRVALFFGLSGTGKTTLSADPERLLIGDDEHGWSARGVFNFEGGCYAKCINLNPKLEPQIFSAIRFGTVLENVVVDPKTREPDYDSSELTENTRAAYPVEYIPGALLEGVGNHPRTIVFLTADASGVLPPIAKLTKEQAMYHFLSGYTSKLAGTERGVTQPEPTFSACFGGPFLPLHPRAYATMLGERIEKHQTSVFLVNTGWSGGPYGVGSRMKLSYTRAMVNAALRGDLDHAEYVSDPVFGLAIPAEIDGIPSELLQPRETWSDPVTYDTAARELAAQFEANFKKFTEQGIDPSILSGGPVATRNRA